MEGRDVVVKGDRVRLIRGVYSYLTETVVPVGTIGTVQERRYHGSELRLVVLFSGREHPMVVEARCLEPHVENPQPNPLGGCNG